jgi:uncharacterized protein
MVWFEWDEAKAKANERKHGVRFDDALLVFADPHALMEQDRVECGELRWQTIGLAGGVVLLLVAHTVRDEGVDEIIRIISARKATRKECQQYDENREENYL